MLEIRNYIEDGNLLECLEETGRINIDHLDDDIDLDLLIKVLDNDYNLPCRLLQMVGGCYLENEHFEENRPRESM